MLILILLTQLLMLFAQQYTISGKKVEVAVERIISGEDVVSQRGALANPSSLDLYYNLPDLQLPNTSSAN